MSGKLLLRIAAILMLLHTFGHTMGALTWKQAPTPELGQVIATMQNHHFSFMGRSVSIAGFYEGYGMSMIFVLLMVSILLWLLSGDGGSKMGVSMMVVLSVFLLLLSVIEYIYFFAFAAAFSFLSAVLTGMAVFRVRKA